MHRAVLILKSQMQHYINTIAKYAVILLTITAQVNIAEAQEPRPIRDVEGLFYTVQLGNFSNPEPGEQISSLSDLLVEELITGEYRFSTGVYREISDARNRKGQLETEGFTGVFVIAYEDGERISLRALRERVLDEQKQEEDFQMPVFISSDEPAPTEIEQQISFDFQISDGNILSETAREVSDLFENQILEYRRTRDVVKEDEVQFLFGVQFDTLQQFQYDSIFAVEKAKRLRNDWGLSFSTWYIYNLQPGIGPIEEVFYDQRLNVTLQMDVLRGGYLDNKKKAEAIEKKLEIESLMNKQERERDRYEDLYNYIIYVFNDDKVKLVEERLKLLKKKKLIMEMLYTGKARSWEDLIDTRSHISRTQNMLDKWKNYNSLLREEVLKDYDLNLGFRASELPVLDIIPDSLFGSDQNVRDSIGYKIADLKSEIVDLESGRAKDVSLRPFARYSFVIDDGPIGNRTFPSVGVSLNVPINWRKRENMVAARKDVYANQTHKKHRNDNHQLLNYYYEYEYKREQLQEFYHRMSKVEERLRKQIIMYQYNDPNFSPLNSIQYMDEIYAIKTEVVDIKQTMYLRLLKMMEYLESESPLDFSEIIDPEDELKKYNQKRDFYMWSKFFYAHDNLFLIHYLKVNEVNKLFLSLGPQVNEEKVRDFIKLANRFNVEVHGMVGNNGMAIDVVPQLIEEYVEQFHQFGFKGIHYDIEPQTFPDWDENKELYVNNLIETYRLTKILCEQYGLFQSASIPTYYPEQALPAIYENLDKVYLMAYERPEIEFIKRKTREEYLTNKDKTVLSLRTKDFENRLIMEKFIEAITEVLNIDHIAIHDLGTLYDLDYDSSF